jgi:hypothetical protein
MDVVGDAPGFDCRPQTQHQTTADRAAGLATEGDSVPEHYHVRLALSEHQGSFRVELFTEDLGDTSGDLLSSSVWDQRDPDVERFREASYRGWIEYLAERGLEPDENVALDLGKRLFAHLLGQPHTAEMWSAVLTQARSQGKRLRVLIDADERVNDLPFGLLCDRGGNYLAWLDTPAVQFLRILRQCRPRQLNLNRQPIRLLLLAAEPRGGEPIGAAVYLRELAKGFKQLPRFAVRLRAGDRLVSLAEALDLPEDQWGQFGATQRHWLRAALDEEPFDLIHVLAHGYGGGLVLCQPDGGPDRVTAQELARWCRESRKKHKEGLELAFLQVCAASDTAGHGWFGGLAQKLLSHDGGDFAAVVGSPYPVLADAGTAGAARFYQGLANDPENPDVALGGAREVALTTWVWAFLELWIRPGTLSSVAGRGLFQFPCPYRGLARFEERHADIFRGRTREVADLLQNLADEPVVPVVGESGSGKSSLLQAGLAHEVRQHGLLDQKDWRIVSLRPGEQPARSLIAALASVNDAAEPTDWLQFLRDSLNPLLQNGPPLLVLLDQFEEVFTLCRDDRQRDALAGWLAEAAQAEATRPPGRRRFRLVLATRHDFQTPMGTLPALGTLVKHLLLLTPPAPEEVAQIIAEPARQYGYEFQGPLPGQAKPGLVQRILQDALPLRSAAVRPGASPRAGMPLPLLEFALQQLWLEAVGRGGHEFTHADYEKIGELGGAIARHANRVYELLPQSSGLGNQAQQLAQQVFTGIVDPRGTRRPQPRRGLENSTGNPTAARKVVDVLVGERLLTLRTDPADANASQVDLAHEVLVERWQTLRTWLAEDPEGRALQQEFQKDAERWDQGVGGLPPRSRKALPGPYITKRYLTWYDTRKPSDLSPAQLDFMNALRASPRSRLGGVGGELLDFNDVAEVGWAVVFAENLTPEVRNALQPLLDLRRRQIPVPLADPSTDRFKVLGYRSDESWRGWLRRHDVAPGRPVFTKVPYYLLLVGGPADIPFESQYLLDVDYAVGRLAFETPAEYGAYTTSVVAYETASSLPNAREIVYWGPRHSGNQLTQLMTDHLLTPLSYGVFTATGQPGEPPLAKAVGYTPRWYAGAGATKARIQEVLHRLSGAPLPAMLIAAAHGYSHPPQHPRQQMEQGALLCQDYPGFGDILPDHLLSAEDIGRGARVHGLVVFLLANFSAGTPTVDNFPLDRQQPRATLADQPFVSALPQRLLSHPDGGALAVIGHVERIMSYSILAPGIRQQPVPFRGFIARLLSGEPVGAATSELSDRSALLSMGLVEDLDQQVSALRPTDEELNEIWNERNDARNFILLGDPAVQMRVELLRPNL